MQDLAVRETYDVRAARDFTQFDAREYFDAEELKVREDELEDGFGFALPVPSVSCFDRQEEINKKLPRKEAEK
jgi:hypothetical protein